ncbi:MULTISPECIES: 8-amino-7-oxononanoate synthase [unclassified Sphingomonas]|uniref:8-amino-7-oxononanoate synthase n=1 Tax=unclassified Sphingomonas TaxID=196159 RepID=UPI00285F989F|nr:MULTISPECIES: 8-amino-7-oxononanoate synthase [unclassified Sphingomonas]MDR6114283.1 8-amino-7-oxononanoate synthase [Sphingomonas sp. SORGH_AS_0789]MDR6148357.1 8-amino-7-oxononanoate synthase [Sphingomonas sp. SORGH_AS_0742]
MLDFHRADLARLAARDRLRVLAPMAGKDFASNDYLGLANSPRLAAAMARAIEQGVPVGSGGSRLLRGNHPEHEALETEAAAFFGAEASLYFSSGYTANVAIMATLPQRGDLIVHDALVHASMHEGMTLSRATSVAAAHNDAGAFEQAIRTWRAQGGKGTPWIAVESLYSMDGDTAPLADLMAVAERHDAMLVVDEAHATGVFGERGQGLSSPGERVVTLHTCGKAMGCEGALVAGPAILRDYLVNRGRGFIFSTAPSPLMARGVRESLRILAEEPERRAALHARIALAGEHLARHGASARGTPIMPLILGDNGRTMRAAQALQARGFDIRGIRPPTVPVGAARLRLSITLNVEAADILALDQALQEVLA